MSLALSKHSINVNDFYLHTSREQFSRHPSVQLWPRDWGIIGTLLMGTALGNCINQLGSAFLNGRAPFTPKASLISSQTPGIEQAELPQEWPLPGGRKTLQWTFLMSGSSSSHRPMADGHQLNFGFTEFYTHLRIHYYLHQFAQI